MDKREIGKRGEEIAKNYLEKKGYKILERNYAPKIIPCPGEIDLIAEKEGAIIFFEVKLSSSLPGEEKVDFVKRRKIKKTAEFFLMEKGLLDKVWQLDIISLEFNKKENKIKIHHFKNIPC